MAEKYVSSRRRHATLNWRQIAEAKAECDLQATTGEKQGPSLCGHVPGGRSTTPLMPSQQVVEAHKHGQGPQHSREAEKRCEAALDGVAEHDGANGGRLDP